MLNAWIYATFGGRKDIEEGLSIENWDGDEVDKVRGSGERLKKVKSEDEEWRLWWEL